MGRVSRKTVTMELVRRDPRERVLLGSCSRQKEWRPSFLTRLALTRYNQVVRYYFNYHCKCEHKSLRIVPFNFYRDGKIFFHISKFCERFVDECLLFDLSISFVLYRCKRKCIIVNVSSKFIVMLKFFLVSQFQYQIFQDMNIDKWLDWKWKFDQ